MDSVAKSIGMTLRSLRKKQGKSQSQLGAEIGKTQSQIARLEAGRGDPQLSSIVQVARRLGVEMVAVPIRLLPVVRHLIAENESIGSPERISRLVGNDPEDAEDDDES
jgi:transcriptional regulator with XRE-family HTH domain